MSDARPLDETLGKQLAEQVAAAVGDDNRVGSVGFAYDIFAELGEVDRKARITVSPFNLEETREARGFWSVDISLLLSFVVRAGVDDGLEWFGGYLALWDRVVETIRDDRLVSSIESEGRYRIDQLENHKRLISQRTVILETQDPKQ